MELNYEKDLEIDETALDVEWTVVQEQLAMKYIKNYVICTKEYKIAHEEVKTIRSELILKVRRDPQRYLKVPKCTDPLAEAYYRTHKRYKKAKSKMIDLEYEKNMAEGAKNEICFTRKTALEELSNLLSQQYFAGPRSPRNIHKEANKRRKELKTSNLKKISNKLSKKMKRTKRSKMKRSK